MSNLTPMMQQYMDIKEQYKDCILFFRLGDFYEMFFEDAKIASRELEITLTGRDCGLGERAPMCGVPFHSSESYISKLIYKGYKVAICEQVEEVGASKGIVKRDVIKIVTPGTVTDSNMLDEKKNNYLMSMYMQNDCFGLSFVDISTGEFNATEILTGNTVDKLFDEIAKYSPSEIVISSDTDDNDPIITRICKRFGIYISRFDSRYFDGEYCFTKIESKFFDNEILRNRVSLALNSAGSLLEYVEKTQKVNLEHIRNINSYKIEEFMILDVSTRRNLELTETMREKCKKGSLIWVLDRTMTSMGGRTIRKWLEQPLINANDINERLNAVSEVKDKFMLRSEARELLKRVYDVERIVGKVILGNVNCRDLISLKNSIGQIPYIKALFKECGEGLNNKNYENLDELSDIFELIDNAIIEEPPVALKEGGIIKTGYNEQVDKLRSATTEGKNWILALEAEEKKKTGIKNLKVGFNKVFGYYIEVTKSYYSSVPANYVRKQTLANCERYIIDELKKIEDTVLGAETKVVELEYQVFLEVRDKIATEINRLKLTSNALAKIDVICALAELADREDYVKPEINQGGEINIIDGRHPVVEKMLDLSSFVPNDTLIDLDENTLNIITGPNMAGKSTYMRQTALIVLMAQIGSFVPAKFAKIGIADRIFTRVGAADDLSAGQSTFMVEMAEVAHILSNATSKSLLILDEIGRGTSTFDGLSIAWSVIEFISDKKKLGCRTLFATHYHELTELEGKIPGVKNYCISVQEKGEDIIFLRKIIRGGADESYGIQVARLAGVPHTVIDRANEILKELETADITKFERKLKKNNIPIEGQLDFFTLGNKNKENDEVIKELMVVDISKLTPLEALNILSGLQQRVSK